MNLIVLDLAGTTVDFGSCAPARVFVELFRQHGVEASIAEAREPMGLQKRDHIRAMAAIPAIAKQWERAHARPFSESDLNALYAEFVPLQLAVLSQFSELIPGTAETVARWLDDGLKIAATTGYDQRMMDLVLADAAKQGFVPDVSVCADHVPAGRPAPWMIFRAMERAEVFPPASVVNIGDTLADVESGRNAGVWSVGVAATGNMLGLTLDEWLALPNDERELGLAAAREAMRNHGAHFVVDRLSDCPAVIEHINACLAAGCQP